MSSQGESNVDANTKTKKPQKKKATWNEKILEDFLDICIGEIHAGNRPGTSFNRAGWQNLIGKLNEKFGYSYDQKQLKNKLDNLKKDWVIWTALIGKDTGLGWDPIKKTVDAPDEWWEKKLQEVPLVAKFRATGLAFASKLDIMFRGTAATGEGAWAPSSGIVPDDIGVDPGLGVRDEGYDGVFPENIVDSCDEHDRNAEGIDDISIDLGSPNQTSTVDAIKEKGKKKISSKLQSKKMKKGGGIQMVSQQLNHFFEAVESRSTMTSKRSDKPGCSIEDVMDVVKVWSETEGDTELYMNAGQVLVKRSNREMFAAYKEPQFQIEWLRRMIKKEMTD